MLTAEQLQDVKERADKATPGEWLINVHYDENGAKEGTCDIHTNNEPVACYTNEYDAQFIAHARQDIPELLQQVASLQDEYERMKQSRNHRHRVAVGRRMATTELKGRLDRTELAEAKARMENEQMRKNILELREYIGQQEHSDFLEYVVDILYDISQGKVGDSDAI